VSDEADTGLVLIRVAAELTIKGLAVRKRFMQALRGHIREALDRRGISHRLIETHGRMFVACRQVEQATVILQRVFGLSSCSPIAATCRAELDEILEVGGERFADVVRGRSYAVRARRQGRHSFGSTELERALGARLNNSEGAWVKLKDPDVCVQVDILGERAHLFSERCPGAGGLPSAVQGKAVALMSGGFDSAVAAWRIMKRGVAVDFVFCNLGGAAYERMVLQVTRVLVERWALGYRPRLHVVDFAEVVAELKRVVKPGYWQVLLKRLMYQTAAAVADEQRAHAVVTGESIAQVSSQTIVNLSALAGSIELPLLRPLIGCDKTEIIDQARLIGTASLSERVKEYCGLGVGLPVTAGKRSKVRSEASKMDDGLLRCAVAERKVIDVLGTSAGDLRLPYLLTSELPAGAVLLDCQPAHLYRAQHAPGAEHHDPSELMERFRELDKERTYVLYCTNGPRAVQICELMQQAGYEAYAFEGGLPALLAQLGIKDSQPGA